MSGRLTPPLRGRDHLKGPEDAAITLVEYGDYECPYCGQAHPVIQEIQRRLGDRLRFAFRNFPLTRIHPHAQHAAEAAEAAGTQGAFWEMHDWLFEHQRTLGDAQLVGAAGELGLESERFNRELADHVHASRVQEDFLSGVRSGVNGTPTFFINGVRHDAASDMETLLRALLVSTPAPESSHGRDVAADEAQ